MRISSFRVDPTVGTDKVKETPIELAANMESTELLTLFAEFVELPPEINSKLNYDHDDFTRGSHSFQTIVDT